MSGIDSVRFSKDNTKPEVSYIQNNEVMNNTY